MVLIATFYRGALLYYAEICIWVSFRTRLGRVRKPEFIPNA